MKTPKFHIQDIAPRASVHKQVSCNYDLAFLSFKAGDSRVRLNHARGLEFV